MQTQQTNPSDPLYTWWFDVLPALLGGLAVASGNEENATLKSAVPLPVGQTLQALKLTQQLLESVYGRYFRMLTSRRPGEELSAFEDLLRGRIAGADDKLAATSEALSDHASFKAPIPGLAGAAMESIAQLFKPLSTNVERTYGGLVDAFGLAPLREFGEATREMSVAALARQRAQAEYVEFVLGAYGKGLELLMKRLAEMGERGETVDTMSVLVRLWAATTDEAMHEAMQSPRALQAAAELIRARARSRQHQQRIVAIASEALDVPTRAEMDEVYREIQELKRELRRSRKSVVLSAPAPSRARKTTSQRGKPKGAAVASSLRPAAAKETRTAVRGTEVTQ